MMRSRPLLPALLLLAGCHGGGGAPAGPLEVGTVNWNSSAATTGNIAALADLGSDVVLFSDAGAIDFAGGAIVAEDVTVTTWAAGAVIPAADGDGTWPVGVTSDGRLFRLAAMTTLEEISDRYGLSGQPVTAVADLGNGLVGFSLTSGELAVADGTNVTRYETAFPGMAGGGGRVSAASGDQVIIFDPIANEASTFSAPGATYVTFDSNGKVVAASAHEIYGELSDGSFAKLAAVTDGTIQGLATSGANVWVAVDTHLAVWANGAVSEAAMSALPATDAALVSSPSGDVWVLSGGALSRFAATSGSPDEALWQATIEPIFTSVCSACHLPGGSSGYDLSNYAAWATKRELIEQRVIAQAPSPMPPIGSPVSLTPAELAAIQAWVAPAM